MVLLAATACGNTDLVDVRVGDAARGPWQGSFHTSCDYSHSLQDDPITAPGVPGVSHLHDFFGNTGIDAHSTLEFALADESTCEIRQDTASYWTPALYADGVHVTPRTSMAYYRVAAGVELAAVEPYPPGLMLIAGDQTSIDPQDPATVGWSCGTSPHITPEPSGCPPGADIRLRLVFPDCWNGDDLRSLDNGHVAHSGRDGCPPSHPVAMPVLEFSVFYEATDPSVELRLASGSLLTAHGDFFNAWNQDRLANEVERCLRRNVYC